MHHHNQHDNIRVVAVFAIAMFAGLLAGGGRANGQALNDSSPGVSDVSSGEPVTIDVAGTGAASDDATTANPVDDSSAPSVSDNSAAEPAPTADATVSDEVSGSGAEGGAVLEVPQVVNLPSSSNDNRPADEALANSDGNDDDTAQSGQDGQNTAADDDFAAAAGQVGTLQDYEDQAGRVPLGPIFFAPGFAVVRVPRPPLFNPLPRPLFRVPMAMSPIILPPTSSGPFPSTSPMLMAPRLGTLGSFRGGGLMGLHR